MACSIEKTTDGKVNKVKDSNGQPSKLFEQIFNVPTLTLEQSIEIYKNTFSSKVGNDGLNEPNLIFETPSGAIFDNYLDALQNTNQGDIALKVNDVTIATVNSDTNIDTFEGSLNYFTKNGVLDGTKTLDVNGDVITNVAGETDTARQLTSDLVETIATKLLGASSVKRLNTGNFVFTDNLNKRIINGELVDEKVVNEMDYNQLKANFGEETAIEIEVGREFEKQLLPTTTKKRIDEDTEIKSEDELTRSIRSLLNELGVKITSIEDYEKNNKLKNDGVPATSTALMDVVNKIMAFREGTITRDDLIEETMHLIEASLDPKTTEAVRKVIHTTPEWKEHSALYYELYSKEYTGEKLEEMVRREILGKVMANGVATNFQLSQDATLTNQSIFQQIQQFLTDFFDKVGAYFSGDTQSKIDQLNKDIYVKLIAGNLAEELNTEQNFGTKFRLYSASTNISNDLVQIQKQAESALNTLRAQAYLIAKNDASQKSKLKFAEESLAKVGEQFKVLGESAKIAPKTEEERNDKLEKENTAKKIARAELAATFSHITNVAQKQLVYLQRAVKRNAQNNSPFSSEESAVYHTMLEQFDRRILPAAKETLENKTDRTKAEDRILEEVDKTIEEVIKLKGKVNTRDRKAKDAVVDMLVTRLGLSDDKRAFIENQLGQAQLDTNFLFKNFGTLAHSSNIYLNAAGHVITRTTYETNDGTLKNVLPFIERIENAGYLGAKVKEFAKNGYLQNRFDDKAREDAISQAKYDIYKNISKDDISKEEFDKMGSFPKLTVDQTVEADNQFSDWYVDNIALSTLSPQEKKERKKELETYSTLTQNYERTASLSYFNIMQNAEMIDGIGHFTQDMKYDFNQLKKDRVEDKSVYDRDGEKREGIEYRTKAEYERSLVDKVINGKTIQTENNIVQLTNGLYASLVPGTTDNSSILSFELSKLDNNRIATMKASNKEQKGFSVEFMTRLASMDNKQAYEFLTLNAYLGYDNEYYESFGDVGIIDRLNEALGGENDYIIQNLIQKIAITKKKLNTILQANREMNNPSEISYTNMEKNSEVGAVKQYSEDLEEYYKEASALIGKRGENIEEESLSETMPNKAFRAHMFDSSSPRVSQLIYNKDTLDQEDLDNINKIYEQILKHTTRKGVNDIVLLRKFVDAFSAGSATKIDKRYSKIFSKTEQEYSQMSQEQIFASMTNDALQYSYTKLLPYFRKTQPKGVDKALVELEAGMIKPSDFLNNYFKGEYPYLNITPNYNFQKADEANNKNPHFSQARANGTPLFRTFNVEANDGSKVTEESIKNKSIDQLYKEGSLNKFVSKEFLEEYNIDLVHLFKTGEEKARKNEKKFEAREAFVDLQKQTLDLYGELNSHNLYKLPQKEKGRFRKIEDILKNKGGIRAIADELINFREDENSLGQNISGEAEKSVKNISVRRIPKKGLRETSQGEATDELLASYTWMNKEANLYASRLRNYGDMLAIKEALLGSEFENNLSVETTNVYKMFDEFMQYNFMDVKETWSSEFQIPGTKIRGDLASVLKSFGKFIRFRNLGYTLISPITSAISASATITIEKLVGENINTDAVAKAKKLMVKHANGSMREMLSMKSTSWLNAVGNKFGFFENEERFNNSNYGKTVRFLGRSPYIAHTIFNFPTNPLAALSVLADHKFVDGKLIQYRDYKQENKHKTDRELKESWKMYVDMTDVIVVEKNGVVTYDYGKIADAMNTNMTEEEAKTYMDNASVAVYNKIKIAIQKIDGQISAEDKASASRNAFTSFMGIHRNWLFVATQVRFKKKQLSFATQQYEEGSYTTVGRGIKEVIRGIVSGEAYKNLSYFKEKWENGSPESRRNLKRVAIEMGVLNALVALTLLALKEGNDDDEDGKLLKLGSLFTYRLTNEIASSTVGLPKNVVDVINQLVVGLNSVDALTDVPDLFSDEIVKGGKFKGLTEREKYLYNNVPIAKDYRNLGEGLDANIASYNYFNLDKGESLRYFTLYPFLVDSTKKEK